MLQDIYLVLRICVGDTVRNWHRPSSTGIQRGKLSKGHIISR